MNIAMFLKPKVEVAYLYDDYSLRQGLEKMSYHGYTAIPVISRSGKYYSTISEGDFLWHIVSGENTEGKMEKTDIRSLEDTYIRDIVTAGKNPPVRIAEPVELLFERALNQNFVPVIDDMDSFIGIITRKDILEYLFKAGAKSANI